MSLSTHCRHSVPAVYNLTMLKRDTRTIMRNALALGRVLLFWLATMVALATAAPLAGAGASAAVITGVVTSQRPSP